MKTIFFVFILLCNAIIAVAQPVITQKTPSRDLAKPKAPDHLYLKVHFTPLIVIGTLSEWDFDATTNKIKGKIGIKTVLKGDVENKKMLDVSLNRGYELTKNLADETPTSIYEKGKTYVFFLYKTSDSNWEISNFHLNINAPNTLILKQNKKTKVVTIDDCQKGIVLFDKNYEDFKTKSATNTNFTLKNPTDNQTFSFLSHEMLGELIGGSTK